MASSSSTSTTHYYLDPSTTVDAYGRWVVDPAAFPDGMAAVGELRAWSRPQVRLVHDPRHPRRRLQPEHAHPWHQLPRAGHRRPSLSPTRPITTARSAAIQQKGDVQHRLHQARRAGVHQFLGQPARLVWDRLPQARRRSAPARCPTSRLGPQPSSRPAGTIHFELSDSWLHAAGPPGVSTRTAGASMPTSRTYRDTSYPLTDWSNVANAFQRRAKLTPPAAGPGHWSDLDSLELGNGADTTA